MVPTKTILNQFHYFTQSTLRAGTLAVNAIHKLYVNGDTILADMQSRPFTPALFLEDDQILDMECDCRSHTYCEHLASLLLYLYKNQDNSNKAAVSTTTKEKLQLKISHGFINDFRVVHNPEVLHQNVDKADMHFYGWELKMYTISLFTDNKDQLNFLMVRQDKDLIDGEEQSVVELKWMDKELYIRCEQCMYTSETLCFHQKIAFVQDFQQTREFLSQNLDIDSLYAQFDTISTFSPSILQKHFYIGFNQMNQAYLLGKTNVLLINANLIEGLEQSLNAFVGNSEEQNSFLEEIYTGEETTTGNAILWTCNNFQDATISYLEGKLSKNGKKLISHIKRTNEPASIPFSIQYDLRKININFEALSPNRRNLLIQSRLNFLQQNVDRLSTYIHYYYSKRSDVDAHKISKNELHQFSFADEILTPRLEARLDQDVLVVRLYHDLLVGKRVEKILTTIPFFLIVDKNAYVFRNHATQRIVQSPNHEIKYLFNTKDTDSMRRGISQIINFYDINISDLEAEWVKTISARKRIIQLSQNGNRIVFKPLLKDATGQNTFNLFQDRCLPATEDPCIVHIPEPKRKAEFMSWFSELHPKMDRLTEPLGFHTLPLEEFVKDHWFLGFSEHCEQAGVDVEGWDTLQSFSFNPNRGEIEQSIADGPDWFDLNFVIRYGDILVPQKEWIRAVRKGERSILLKDGSYGIIPEEWRLRMIRLLNSAEVNKYKIQLSTLHFNALERYVDLSDNPEIRKDIENKKARLIHFKGLKTFDLPESIQAELRSYQKEGYQWLKFLNEYRFGGCLADDMGLGKTLQVLSLLADQKGLGHPASLVVVPRSLVHNWVDEIEKFCPEMTYYIHHGPQRKENTKEFSDFDLMISTYGTISNDIKWIKNYTFHYVILDESQAIKNPESQRYRSMIQLSARHKLTMTGTPIENSTMDLYAQFNFVNPGLLGNKSQFRKRFSDPIEKNGDTDVKDLLQKIIHPFLLRRTKTQVTKDLPPKTESILYCDMEGEQKKIYELIRNEIRASLLAEDQLEKNKMKVLDGLLKLRQICNSPALLPDNGVEVSKNPPAVKIDVLMKQIEEVVLEEGHTILVFSQFTSMLAQVRKRLDETPYQYAYLDGKTTNRKAVIQDFNNDPDIKIFLLSLKAGNVGLNLTKADFVYLLDPWWNPAVESQAIDRTHRIGQTKPVFAYRLICKDSIEEKIMKLQSRKNKLAEELIQTDENVFKSLDRSELISLFE